MKKVRRPREFPGDMGLGEGLHVWEVLLSSTEGGVWIKGELEVL